MGKEKQKNNKLWMIKSSAIHFFGNLKIMGNNHRWKKTPQEMGIPLLLGEGEPFVVVWIPQQ